MWQIYSWDGDWPRAVPGLSKDWRRNKESLWGSPGRIPGSPSSWYSRMIGLMIGEQSELWHRSSLNTTVLFNLVITCEVTVPRHFFLDMDSGSSQRDGISIPHSIHGTITVCYWLKDSINRRGVAGAIPQRRLQMLGIKNQNYVSPSYRTTSALKSWVGSSYLKSVTYVTISRSTSFN